MTVPIEAFTPAADPAAGPGTGTEAVIPAEQFQNFTRALGQHINAELVNNGYHPAALQFVAPEHSGDIARPPNP